MENKDKILKTIQIIVNAVLAIAALWLAVSCTVSMSLSKNNTNSTQSTEQSSQFDSIYVNVPRETIKTLNYGQK